MRSNACNTRIQYEIMWEFVHLWMVMGMVVEAFERKQWFVRRSAEKRGVGIYNQ